MQVSRKEGKSSHHGIRFGVSSTWINADHLSELYPSGGTPRDASSMDDTRYNCRNDDDWKCNCRGAPLVPNLQVRETFLQEDHGNDKAEIMGVVAPNVQAS